MLRAQDPVPSPHARPCSSRRPGCSCRRRRVRSSPPRAADRHRRDLPPPVRARFVHCRPRTPRPRRGDVIDARVGRDDGDPGGRIRHARRRGGARSLRNGRLGRRRNGSRRRRGSRGRRRSRGRLRGDGLGCWCGRRRGDRRRVGGTSRRKEREGIHVVVVGADPDSQMDVRHGVLGLARRAGVCDGVALRHLHAALDAQRAEVRQRRLVPVAGDDRHRQPVRGHRPCERDLTRCGSTDHRSAVEGDVDPPMLAARVLVVSDRVAAQHSAVGRPGPGQCRGADRQRPPEHEPEAECASRCPPSEHRSTVARTPRGRNAIDALVTETGGRGRSGTHP
jgi:hypothetical protein